jgi:hypothetical protein
VALVQVGGTAGAVLSPGGGPRGVVGLRLLRQMLLGQTVLVYWVQPVAWQELDTERPFPEEY